MASKGLQCFVVCSWYAVLDYESTDLASGTVLDGEQKLLFSSAQVDYLRYWLHAMNLTKEIIPLPHSEHLLLESEFSQVSPQEHHTGKLRNVVKVLGLIILTASTTDE